MQRALSYRTNRDLFSNHYLDDLLPETEAWQSVDDEEVREAFESISSLFEEKVDQVESFNEHQLERHLIRPVFNRLDLAWETEEAVHGGGRRPDYAFFKDDEDRQHAFTVRDEGEDFYRNAIAVGDAKRWGRPLDKRSGHEEEFSNPSFQIHIYLQQTPPDWGVLTNGKKWRLYYAPSSYQFDSYYEIDLPTVLDEGDLEAFRYFYLFFRRQAFVEDSTGRSFLDRVHEGSNAFAQELGDDLRENIYEAIGVLAEGFLQYDEDHLSAEDLDLIHDASLTYLYRLIFVLYAESEGRHLLDTREETYRDRYSLTTLKREVCEAIDENDDFYPWETRLWDRLDRLFTLIDRGSENLGIDPDELYVPAYDGGLFKTHDVDDASRESRFLQEHAVGDENLSEVIDLLTRREAEDGSGMAFVDYSSLGVRHLGSIYEGLLEYQLNVADAPMVAVRTDSGQEWRTQDEADSDDVVAGTAIDEGDVYLTTDTGERKATGSYYTPEYVVQYIIQETLDPLVEEIREDLLGGAEENFAEAFAERVFDLKILDPAMGSGHFLVDAVDYLAKEIMRAQDQQNDEDPEPVEDSHDVYWARRQIAQRCIYGVDLNPMATELAKVSLWLRTLAAEQPLAFLDHHLKTGNSLVGSDIEEVLENGAGDHEADDDQLTLTQSFNRTRRQALDHVTNRFQELLAIDNETLEDVREMEAVFEEVRDDPLYRHLLAMANVHTADEFGLDVPSDAYERMAVALRDDSWDEVEKQDWFRSAQAMAEEERFFHWELEFPVAFYGEDGERDADAGFDAVVGNPPYLPTEQLPEIHRKYLTTEFDEVLHRKYDSSVAFLQQSFRLCRNGEGFVGMITPVVWETGENYTRFREYNFISGDVGLVSIVNLPFDIFKDAYVDTTIAIFSPGSEVEAFSAREFEKREAIESSAEIGAGHTRIPTELLRTDPGFKIYFDKEYYELLRRFSGDDFGRLGDFTDACQGIVASFYDYAEEPLTDEYLRYRECDVYRYECTTTEEKFIDFSDEESLEKYYTQSRILVRRIVNRDDRLMATYVNEDFVTKKDLNPFILTGDNLSLKYMLASLNSALHSYLYIKSSALATKDDFWQTTLAELRSLPIRRVPFEASDDVRERSKDRFIEHYRDWLEGGNRPSIPETPAGIHDTVVELVDELIALKERRRDFVVSLPDYLGNYVEGPLLPDVGIFQPNSSKILDSTTDELENLRIGEVRTERDGSSVTIYATARYKPEDEEKHETDPNGYTETDSLEAFTLADLSETEAALVDAFVPVAVKQAAGFAGFRDNAGKTISLVDRLKAITLPDPDDVEDDLRRYLETKERADELDEKIEKTDRLIDDIVYELYGLTEEEIEIVEASVGD